MTRILEEKCDTCDNFLEMYCTPYCPRCEKPSLDGSKYKIINYFKAVRYVELLYDLAKDSMISEKENININEGYTDCLWSWLLETSAFPGNDCFVELCFLDYVEDYETNECRVGSLDEEQNLAAITVMKLLIKEFDLEKNTNILWEISW